VQVVLNQVSATARVAIPVGCIGGRAAMLGLRFAHRPSPPAVLARTGEEPMSDLFTYEIPGFTTQSGFTLDVKIAYKTFGQLSPAGDNAIVIPTFYAGRHSETEFMLAAGRVIDPSKNLVVIPNKHGNGCSS
jgi:homoserine acetyltransferase